MKFSVLNSLGAIERVEFENIDGQELVALSDGQTLDWWGALELAQAADAVSDDDDGQNMSDIMESYRDAMKPAQFDRERDYHPAYEIRGESYERVRAGAGWAW